MCVCLCLCVCKLYKSTNVYILTLERITAKQVELYSYVPFQGVNIPISVEPLPVEYSIPREDKI